jgi:hypothetical protein
MEPSNFVPNHGYQVFFEKDIPIEFKYLETTKTGEIKCQRRDGKKFNFNKLQQHLSIRETYPQW